MNIDEILDNESFNAATEYSRDRLVLVGDGTGNLIKINDRHFIVTCKHVAQIFFDNNFPYTVIRDNIRISYDNLELIAETNDNIDIALIEIKKNFKFRGFYEFEDIELIDDLNEYDWRNSFCFICGLPGSLTFKNCNGIQYPYCSFTSSINKNIIPDKNFIFLNYDISKEEKMINTNLNTFLPSPKGLSGSFILKITKESISNDFIWTPKKLKVIGIVNSWKRGDKYIKGTNISHFITLLKQTKII